VIGVSVVVTRKDPKRVLLFSSTVGVSVCTATEAEAEGVPQSLSDWTARSMTIGCACIPLCTLAERICVLWSLVLTGDAGNGDRSSGQFHGPVGEMYRRTRMSHGPRRSLVGLVNLGGSRSNGVSFHGSSWKATRLVGASAGSHGCLTNPGDRGEMSGRGIRLCRR